jgi:hypothetical protein
VRELGDRLVTMIDHLVVRLHGDEDWEAWGDRWWDHIDKVGDLHWVGHSGGPYRPGQSGSLTGPDLAAG